MRDGHLRGSLPRTPTARQVDVLAAFVAAGGSVADAAEAVGARPSTAKRHLADLRARSGLTTVQPEQRHRGGIDSSAARGAAPVAEPVAALLVRLKPYEAGQSRTLSRPVTVKSQEP